MAGLKYAVSKSGLAYAQNIAKTALYVVAAANQPLRVYGWGVSFDGLTAGQAKILCELCTGTAAGAGTKVGDVTPTALDTVRSETPQAGTIAYGPFSTEPTVLSVVHLEYVDNQNGWKEYFPDGEEILIAGGKAVAIRITTPATLTTCNAAPWLLCEE